MMSALVPGLTPLTRVVIGAGTFAMGSTLFPDSQPVTNVTVSAFEVSETKVTIGAYQEYLEAIGENRWTLAVTNPGTGDVSIVARGKTRAEVMEAYGQSLSEATMSPGARIDLGGCTVFEVTDPVIPDKFKKSLFQPMVKINWWEMLAFAAAHGGDLPTEAEYERVQRGRSGNDEYGTVSGKLRAENGRRLAQFGSDRTSPVKTFLANSWGVFDASGNVWTWTGDCKRPVYSWPAYGERPEVDPQGWPKPKFTQIILRVLCGGAYFDDGDGLHAARRFFLGPQGGALFIGGVVVWRS